CPNDCRIPIGSPRRLPALHDTARFSSPIFASIDRQPLLVSLGFVKQRATPGGITDGVGYPHLGREHSFSPFRSQRTKEAALEKGRACCFGLAPRHLSVGRYLCSRGACETWPFGLARPDPNVLHGANAAGNCGGSAREREWCLGRDRRTTPPLDHPANPPRHSPQACRHPPPPLV